MILYLDSSSLVKKYVEELGSEPVIKLWRNASAIAISTVGYAEIMAAFHRKKRGEVIPLKKLNPIIGSFKNDWASFIRIEVSSGINPTIDRLVSRYPLRGFDAIHLASALSLHHNLNKQFLFVCHDSRLLQVARSEKLPTYPKDGPGDPHFEEAIKAQDEIDCDLWK